MQGDCLGLILIRNPHFEFNGILLRLIEEILSWLMLTAALEVSFDPLRPAKEVVRGLENCWSVI